MKRILFSPVGFSDPTRGNYDGPLLHIIRWYQPEEVYLFLTKETLVLDEKLNLYEEMASFIKPDIKCFKLAYPELVKVNDFNIFDRIFKKELIHLQQSNPDSEILINITSGTGQMISSLYMLSATLPFKVSLIQVDTHEKAANKSKPVDETYIIDFEKENLFDNLEDESIINRCREVTPENILLQNMINAIEKHLEAYDYDAALKTALQIKAFFPDIVMELLEMAKFRSELDHLNAKKIMTKHELQLYPIQSADVMQKFEYLLYLQKNQVKQHLNDFARGLSPIIFNLFMDLIINKSGVFIKKEFCKGPDRNNVWFLKRNLLAKDPILLEKYYDQSDSWNGEFKDSALAASNILPLILYYSTKIEDIKNYVDDCKLLRDIEQKIRNKAAHEIINISEEDFQREAGISSEKTMKILKKMFEFVYDKHRKNIKWDSYDQMNQHIIKIIKENY